MGHELSLRERKKRETRQHIADVAMGLFMARGFDNVTVAQVAEAANVSVNTVFNYFKTKEDLFLDRHDMVVDSIARVVREAPPGESLVTVLRRDFEDALATGHWRYGIADGVSDFVRLASRSPSLVARLREMHALREEALAAALADRTDADPDDVVPRLVATQVLGMFRVVSADYVRRRDAGESAEAVLPSVRRAAAQVFAFLESMIGDYPADAGR